MKKNRKIFSHLFLLLFIFSSGMLFGQSISAGYVEGEVEYSHGSSWSEVFIGDQLQSNGRIRLGSDGYIELLVNGNTVRVSRPGVMALSDLDTAPEASGVNGALAGRVGRFMRTDTDDAVTTVGGVRASEAVSEPEISWAGGEDSRELIEEGLSYMMENDFEEAFYTFEEAYDFADDVVFDEAGFFYAYSAYLIDERDLCVQVMEEISPAPEDSFFVDAKLLYSQVLLETNEFSGAAAQAQEVIDLSYSLRNSDPLSLQMAYYLNGEAFSQMGNSSNANTAFHRAVDIAPQTEIGRLASQRAQ